MTKFSLLFGMNYKVALTYVLIGFCFQVNSQPSNNVSSLENIKISTIEIDNDKDSTISFFILDAGLDKRVQRLEEDLKSINGSTNFRIIAISHDRYSNKLRRRDFIPPHSGTFFKSGVKYTGEANRFLEVLIDDVIPTYDSVSDFRILIGHSFGGLFGVYASTMSNCPFDQIYSLSPSLWLNHFSFIKNYKADNSITVKVPLDIYYGSLEQFNLVAWSNKRFHKALKSQDSELVSINSVKWKNHISIIKCINNVILN